VSNQLAESLEEISTEEGLFPEAGRDDHDGNDGQDPGPVSNKVMIRLVDRIGAERARRRQGEKFGGDFDQCPKFSDLAIAPFDRNNNGTFDTIAFIASPYTAGPYAEGEYEISLPVTSELIRGVRPEYRDSFERQRQ